MVKTFVDLVQHTYGDDLSAREQMGLVRLEQAWRRERTPRQRLNFIGLRALVAALAVAAIVPAGFLAYRRYAHVTYQVVNGTVGEAGLIRPTRPGGTVVVFSEGSQIGLEGAARARVASMTAEGGRVVLEDGDAGVEIVHRPHAQWTVEAGPYSIRVTGTAFDVRWSSSDYRLSCRMKRGSVVITGPLVPAGVTLTAGMQLRASPRAGQLTIDDGETAAGAAGGTVAAAAGPAPSAGGDPAPGDDAPGSAEQGPRRRGTHAVGSIVHREALRRAGPAPDERRRGSSERISTSTWSQRIAQGDFQTVLAEAEAEGLDHVLDVAPAGDLSALADAARYTHHATTARRALVALRERLPGSRESRDTAFFLGGLAEGESTSGDRGDVAAGAAVAIDWYDRYLRECPTGRFVNEALGRKMVLTNKLRGSSAAQPLAAEYMRRFPGGPYATAARKLLQAP
jgi:hypothetical protein